jgi:hypothetical protein
VACSALDAGDVFTRRRERGPGAPTAGATIRVQDVVDATNTTASVADSSAGTNATCS